MDQSRLESGGRGRSRIFGRNQKDRAKCGRNSPHCGSKTICCRFRTVMGCEEALLHLLGDYSIKAFALTKCSPSQSRRLGSFTSLKAASAAFEKMPSEVHG